VGLLRAPDSMMQQNRSRERSEAGGRSDVAGGATVGDHHFSRSQKKQRFSKINLKKNMFFKFFCIF
jgi:hypothetical protein